MTILSNAIDYLTVHGWTQGRLRDEKGRVCARGAILHGNPGISREDAVEAEGLILEAAGIPSSLARINGVPSWNDHYATSVDGVIAVMTKADALWLERHPETSPRVFPPVDVAVLDQVGQHAQHVGKAGRTTLRFFTADRQRAVAVQGDREHDHGRVATRIHT